MSRTNRNGGGVLLYIKDELNPVQLLKPKISNIDAVYVILKNNQGTKFVIALVYRPPAQPVQTDQYIYEQISEITDTHEAVILGDFNMPVQGWGDPLTAHHGHDLYTSLQESSLTQLVTKPTRGNNVLDLVFATKDDLVDNMHVGEEFHTSDHRIITFNLNITKNDLGRSNEKIPDFRRANFHKLKLIFEKN